MQLSDGEKLILMMLCDLYDKNEIEGEIDHTFVRDAIFENQTWALLGNLVVFHLKTPKLHVL